MKIKFKNLRTRLTVLYMGMFGVALMLVALAVYLAGQRHLPAAKPKRRKDAGLPPLTAAERRRTAALLLFISLSILPMLA